MRIPTGALSLVAAIVAVGVIGAAIDAGVGDVPDTEQIDVAQRRFESHSWLCPPAPSSRGSLWVATDEEDARVGFEPQEGEASALAGSSLLRHAAFKKAVNIVGYDASVIATATLVFGADDSPVGAGASACSDRAADEWYFAQGSTEVGLNQRIVLYNPFPEEASVQMRLFTTEEARAQAGLSGIDVPANEFVIVDFKEKTNPELGKVGTEIIASRGRVVAWRWLVATDDEQAKGAEFSLGATATATSWYFPDGAQDDDTFTSLFLMNPTDQEASVSVSVRTNGRLIQPPGLEEFVVPPETARPLRLRQVLEDQELPPTFGIVVESTTPLIAERMIASTGEQPGRSSEVGAAAPAERWSLPPVGTSVDNDRLVVLNPANERVDVSVKLTRAEGSPLEPEQLQFSIKRGDRADVSLEQWRDESPFSVQVSASAPVVVERAGQYAGDRSSAIGVPLDD